MLELARTLAVNTLVFMEVFHLFFIRNIHGTSLTWKAVRGTREEMADVDAYVRKLRAPRFNLHDTDNKG